MMTEQHILDLFALAQLQAFGDGSGDESADGDAPPSREERPALQTDEAVPF